eukprot:872015_1
MVREVITVSVGQCGIQLGRRIWEQYNTEHGISAQGLLQKSNQDRYVPFLTFYEETQSELYLPRNLSVDLDPDTIECDLRHIHAEPTLFGEFHVCGNQDAGNIFSRGFYSIGKTIIDQVENALRKLADKCDNIQGFVINHSVGGGTGSGLGSLILQHLAVRYRKKSKLGVEVYPFNNHLSDCVVEPYNALLATHWLLDHTEISFLFDNRKVYNLCQSKLDINAPTYNDMNTLIAKVISSETRSLRFEGELNVDLNEYQTSRYTPFPRLHFFVTSLAPLVSNMEVQKVRIAPKCSKILVDGFVRFYYPFLTQSSDRYKHYEKTFYDVDIVQDLFEMSCDPDYFMVECEDFDVEQDKYLFVTINCAGDITRKEKNEAAQALKTNKNVVFLEWVPPGFKIGLNSYQLPRIDADDKIAARKKVVATTSSNTLMARYFTNRISQKYDAMYSRRAYVHWFVSGGMAEGEFAEAREDLGWLEKDYLDILSEQSTDEGGDDDY